MKSLTTKLMLLFGAVIVVAIGIGGAAALSLRTAGDALDDSNRSLKNLTELLSSANSSLAENVRIQKRSELTAVRIADSQLATAAALKDMSDSKLPRTFAVSQMLLSLSEVTAAERALLLAMNMRHLDEDELKRARDRQMHTMREAMASMREAQRIYLDKPQTDEQQAAWNNVEKSFAAWEANHGEFLRDMEKLEELVGDLVRGGPVFASAARKAYDTAFITGRDIRDACKRDILKLNRAIAGAAENEVANAARSQGTARALTEELTRESQTVARNTDELGGQIEQARTAATGAAERSTRELGATSTRFIRITTASALAVLACFVVGLYLVRGISRPVRAMSRHMSLLAHGNLEEDVARDILSREDEIGSLAKSLQEMIRATRDEVRMANAMAAGDYTWFMPVRSEKDQLGRALRTMLDTTNAILARVGSSVDRVNNGAMAVSDASRSLSQGAQTSATALEEISQSVGSVDAQARDNAVHASEANSLATASREAARRGYGAVSELVAAMGEIQQAGQRIATVVKLIDDIAFQTNLLALNAAVEAARAGRHGKGFSVVADEVRSLSGRSAKAARDTSAMVEAMSQRLDAGAQLAQRSDEEFREIVEHTERVAKLFEEINAASNAQSVAMAQITQGLAQIDSVIQENTNSAECTAASALNLSRQAEELRQIVSRFHVLGPDGNTHKMGRSGIDERTPPALPPGATKMIPFSSGADGDRDGR